jgi:hypothetical protein
MADQQGTAVDTVTAPAAYMTPDRMAKHEAMHGRYWPGPAVSERERWRARALAAEARLAQMERGK